MSNRLGHWQFRTPAKETTSVCANIDTHTSLVIPLAGVRKCQCPNLLLTPNKDPACWSGQQQNWLTHTLHLWSPWQGYETVSVPIYCSPTIKTLLVGLASSKANWHTHFTCDPLGRGMKLSVSQSIAHPQQRHCFLVWPAAKLIGTHTCDLLGRGTKLSVSQSIAHPQ